MVDSCVLMDIFNDDDHWYTWSSNILFKMSKEYNLAINTIIFTEIVFNFDACEQLEETLKQLEIQTLDIPRAATFNVSQLFKNIEETKATRKHPYLTFILASSQAFWIYR